MVVLYLIMLVLWLHQHYGVLSAQFCNKNQIHPASLDSHPVMQNAYCFLELLVCEAEAVNGWDLPTVAP